MIRIGETNIPENKHIIISLTYIFGIGKSRAKKICDFLNIKYDIKTINLDENVLNKIRDFINKYTIESDLKNKIIYNIKRLISINSYRGIRHKKHLPVRGQRTKTNAKTRKKYFKN